jgi:hypothetical protein
LKKQLIISITLTLEEAQRTVLTFHWRDTAADAIKDALLAAIADLAVRQVPTAKIVITVTQ